MPIEIRELVVRATIVDEAEQARGETDPMDDDDDGGGGGIDLEYLIEECVQRVMEKLREGNER